MAERITVIVGMLEDYLPYAILCYYPFMDQLKISKRVLVSFFVLLPAIQITVNLLIPQINDISISIVFYTSLLACFCLFLLTVRANLSKILFVFLMIAGYQAVISGFAMYLSGLFHDKGWNSYYNLPYDLISPVIFAFTVPIIILLLKRQVIPLLKLPEYNIWRTLWIIPLMLNVALICIINDNALRSNWQFPVMTAAVGIISFVIYSLLLNAIYKTNENATLKENARMVGIQLSLQEETYAKLNERIIEAKMARHDLRHHLSVIDAYLKEGESERVRQYLDEYQSGLPDDAEFTVCENYAVNVIVQHYMLLAKTEGVTVTADLNLPQETGIANSDLCIIFGNCLENALEACHRIAGQPYIHVKSELRRNMLVILMDNSFDGNIKRDGEAFLSSKRSGRGIGVSSVQAVAKKYSGAAKFEFTETVFRVSVMLQNVKNLSIG